MFTEILWDFDGTLFDTYPSTVDTLLRALEDKDIREDYDQMMVRIRESAGDAVKYYKNLYHLGEDFEERLEQYYRGLDRSRINLFPQAAEMIKAVHDSGRRNYLYTHRGYSAIQYLEERNLIDCFQDCITREDGFPRKPIPDAIRYLIEKHKLDMSKSLMVGDREMDMLAAKNAGVMACFFDPYTSEKSETADYHIHALEELKSIIGLTE